MLELIPLQQNALCKLCLTSGQRGWCWGLRTNELFLSHYNCIVSGKQESCIWACLAKEGPEPQTFPPGRVPLPRGHVKQDQCYLEYGSERPVQDWPTFLNLVKTFKPWILGMLRQDIEKISDTACFRALSMLWMSAALHVYETLFPVFGLWSLLPELGFAVPRWIWCSGT